MMERVIRKKHSGITALPPRILQGLIRLLSFDALVIYRKARFPKTGTETNDPNYPRV